MFFNTYRRIMNQDILYYRPGCSHCQRIMSAINARPSLNIKMVHVRDATTTISAVPTIITTHGKTLVGGEAFTYVESTPIESQFGYRKWLFVLFLLFCIVFFYSRQ
jgi:hypothetical protein